MRKATFLYLCAAFLLTGAVLGLAFSLGKASQRASAEKITQGNGMMWNATDCNNTYSQNAYSGPQTLSPRITAEYEDHAVKKALTPGVPNFPILPRVVMEFLDAASLFSLSPPQGLDSTIVPRIAVEYADCLVINHTRVGCDVNMDGKCNMKDVGLVAKAYGLTADSPNWNQALDLNGDLKVDMKDVAPVAKHYGEVYT